VIESESKCAIPVAMTMARQCLRDASSPNVQDPLRRVEFNILSLDLPAVVGAVGLDSIEDGDTPDWTCGAGVSEPSISDNVASDCVDGENGEWDGWLGALASLEGGQAGEGGCAVGDASKEVNAV